MYNTIGNVEKSNNYIAQASEETNDSSSEDDTEDSSSDNKQNKPKVSRFCYNSQPVQ